MVFMNNQAHAHSQSKLKVTGNVCIANGKKKKLSILSVISLSLANKEDPHWCTEYRVAVREGVCPLWSRTAGCLDHR